MPVSLPNMNPKRELARKLVEALVSQVPVAGDAAVAVWSVTHPSTAQKAWEAWSADVTKALNDLEAVISQLAPAISLSDDAAAVGVWLSKSSAQGRPESAMFDQLQAEFPEAKTRELQDACGELEAAGLVRLGAVIGKAVHTISPTLELFALFDPIAVASDPRRDAAELARLILAAEHTPGADDLVEQLDWTTRRFNPAMLIVASYIGSGRKSGEVHPEYACRYVMPNPAERARLKAFANSVLGP
jgi:hypothetical protein